MDTFREMKRVKRSVVQQFALVNVATEELLKQAADLKEKQAKAKEAAMAAMAAPLPMVPESKKRERAEALADEDDDPNVSTALRVVLPPVILYTPCDELLRGGSRPVPLSSPSPPPATSSQPRAASTSRSLCGVCAQVYAAVPFSRGPSKMDDVEERAVPESVFGEAREVLEREKRGENVGALGLFKRRRQDDE